jgi:hypothetical protein
VTEEKEVEQSEGSSLPLFERLLVQAMSSMLQDTEGVFVKDANDGKGYVIWRNGDQLILNMFEEDSAFNDPNMTEPIDELENGTLIWMHQKPEVVN